MAYRIPSEDTVRDALRRVLSQHRGTGSLKELTGLVSAALQEDDPRYRISTERVRRIASRMNAIRTTIHTRRATQVPHRSRCPVCGGRLETVKNRTLGGDEVALEARCTQCPYWTGREERVPVRYLFHLREWRFARPQKGPPKRGLK